MKRKLFVVLLSICMLLLVLPASVLAADAPKPLTFTAEENSSVGFAWASGENVEISYDGGETWVPFMKGDSLGLTAGTSVSFRGSGVITDYSNHFSITGKVAASGDVTSLTNREGGDCELTKNCYTNMFNGCKGLTAAPALPSKTLAEGCYANMFFGCTGLTAAPALPATTLANLCYKAMFYGCTGLTAAPALPVKTLAENCYEAMFNGCTGLTAAPALPAATLAKCCYYDMFNGCTGLTAAPALPATTLAEYCYCGMFWNCTGLTAAPALPATTLAEYCYYGMFNGCTGLTAAPALPATTLAEYCYCDMFCDCKGIQISETETETCTEEWKIPGGADAEHAGYGWNDDMFGDTGGTFTGNPVPGKVYYQNCSYVCRIGDTKYQYLKTAVIDAEAASDTEGSTITLIADTVEDITVKKTVTLDLNDHVLKGTGNGSVITVWGGNLTLTDSVSEEAKTERTITVPGSDPVKTVTVKGGVVTGGTGNAGSLVGHKDYTVGGGVYIPGGVFTMNGGNIAGNSADRGGGIYAFASAVYLNDGAVSGNAAAYGGGFYGDGERGTPYLYGGRITDNTADIGGGIYAGDGIHFGGNPVITGNTASEYGGGIVSKSNINLSGMPEIRNNLRTAGGTSAADNMYLSGYPVSIDSKSLGGRTGIGKIGVTWTTGPTDGNPIRITHNWEDSMGTADPADYFESDDPMYAVCAGEYESKTEGFLVLPAQTITAPDVTVTYGDTDKKVTAATDEDGGALSYKIKDGAAEDVVTVDASTGELTTLNTGETWVTVSAAATGTKSAASKDVRVTVNPAPSSLSGAPAAAGGLEYDGQAHALIDLNGAKAVNGTLVFSLNGTDYDADIPEGTEAGTYTVYYKVKGNKNYSDTEPRTINVTIGEKAVAPCRSTREVSLSAGSHELRFGSKSFGVFTFEGSAKGWSIQNADGQYLAGADGRLVLQADPFWWTYSCGSFRYDVTEQCGGMWPWYGGWGWNWGYATQTVSWYLTAEGTNLTVSKTAPGCKAAFWDTFSYDDHDLLYEPLGNGQHKVTCRNCEEVAYEDCEYGTDHKCKACGGIDPNLRYVTVTFVTGKGASAAPASVTVISGEGKVEKPADPVRTGYLFGGWYAGSELFDFDAAPVDDTVLNAMWAKCEDHEYAGGRCVKCGEDEPEPEPEAVCVYEKKSSLGEGKRVLTLGGKRAGEFTFARSGGSWTIRAEDGRYLSVSNNAFTYAGTPFAWTYSNGAFQTTVTTYSSGWGWNWWGGGTTATTYYLVYSGGSFYVSTSSNGSNASFAELVRSPAHAFGNWKEAENGQHVRTCANCGETERENCHYGADHRCTGCGRADPGHARIDVRVKVEQKTSYGSFWFWWSYPTTSWEANITADAAGTSVRTVEYSLDGRTWTRGTTCTSSSPIGKLFVRVTDSGGNVSYWTYENGAVTQN